MPDATERDRERIAAALQAASGIIEDQPELTGSLVTRWVVVCERMDPDGRQWLSRFNSDGMTAWDRRGMLHEALDEATWIVDD